MAFSAEQKEVMVTEYVSDTRDTVIHDNDVFHYSNQIFECKVKLSKVKKSNEK